jgi:hypothetical protein
MARDSAEVRGHAKVRPFRVAQLVDVTSPDAIRDAIANLTVAWGGFYTPIIDANQPCDDIELQARVFDVDALHLEAEEGELLDQLRRAGWLWRGRGQFGPFAAAEEGFRAGVLPASALALAQTIRSACSTRLCSAHRRTRSLHPTRAKVPGNPKVPNGLVSAQFLSCPM